MTKPAMTDPTQIMKRSAASFLPCADCLREYERNRQAVGLGGYCSSYCPHSGVRIGWDAAKMTLEPCASKAEYDRIDEGYLRFLSQVQTIAHGKPHGETN